MEDKSAIVEELAKQAGAKSETVKNFLDTLAENNRLGLLGGICQKFNAIISAAQGEVEMTVTSATVRFDAGDREWRRKRNPWGICQLTTMHGLTREDFSPSTTEL